MTFKLRHKIIILVAVSALLPMAVMSGLILLQKSKLQAVVVQELDSLCIANLKYTATDFYRTCELTNRLVIEDITNDLEVVKEEIARSGGIHISPTDKVRWKAINQDTKNSIEITLPALMLGNRNLEPNYDLGKELPLLDKLKKLTGNNVSIFQRMNERGDMIRVVTNVEINGRRATGTYISAIDQDGNPNPIIEKILKGETFIGNAFVVDNRYAAAYAPLKSANGEIIGCVYTGVKIDAIKNIRDMVKTSRIGKNGYIAITGANGQNKYRYIISYDGTRDGEYLGDIKDADGNYLVRKINTDAVAHPGEIKFIDYNWKNPGDKTPKAKKAAYIYFPQWDWVIMPTMYVEDFNEMYTQVSTRIDRLLLATVIGGFLFFLFAVLVAWYMGNRISRPITRISEVAKNIAEGDLAAAMTGFKGLSNAVSDQGDINETKLSRDETGNLIKSTMTMTKNLNSLVGEVQKATIHLVSTATEIAASSREQEVTVNELGASTNEIVSSTKQISSTSHQLVETMKEVAGASNNAANLADAGRSGLSKMEKSMEQLAVATAAISSKLALINEKTSNINNVVATITKVADQTNLLSLNASIEAEKAGEYGKGFSVVAKEIRRLADQTAVATLDIIKMVKEMQSAVSSGVMGMERFSEDVKQSVRETDLISGQIEGIIREVQVLPAKFDIVIEGMKQQSVGAQQISDSMVQLSECASSTSDSLRAFNEAAGQLNNATLKLQKEVAIFKVR